MKFHTGSTQLGWETVQKSTGTNNPSCTKTTHGYTGIHSQECYMQDTQNSSGAPLGQERPQLQHWAHFKATHFKTIPDSVERARGTPTKPRTTKKIERGLKEGCSRGRINHAWVIQLENNMTMRKEQMKGKLFSVESNSLQGNMITSLKYVKDFCKEERSAVSCPWGQDML